ncbi:MAG TPA: aspartate--ammonia ligase [Bacilli bacterium]|nr:aspartate--ammonia ligase [Bacilli bacterium]
MSIFATKNYCDKLSIIETQLAIKLAKDTFERKLAKNLDLTRVSAPLFVYPDTGLNDNLSGVERPVSFEIKDTGKHAEIVHSLAKWKRMALGKYGFAYQEGLYTDMNAIRRDEVMDNIHSIYVDQWDWEKVISAEDRNLDYLKDIVRKIVKALVDTKEIVNLEFPSLNLRFEKDIYFITSEELLQKYPNLTPKERENAICKEKQMVFIIGIGDKLSHGSSHDQRAPDYDDWQLNGDILVWYEPLEMAIELSSMGIRVDKQSLVSQLKKDNKIERLSLPFHDDVINDRIPLSIGGGIGQSRICLIMLEKVHIGEVQASIWKEEDLKALEQLNIKLL